MAQPVTAVTARIPTKTGLILRSLWRAAVVVIGLPCSSYARRTRGTARPYPARTENVSRPAAGSRKVGPDRQAAAP
ncbi:hypothetical protein GCM10020256_55390 [Streptomyces thermocoprophilus]